MGSSNRTIEYKCTLCGAEPGRANLTVKKAQFATIDGKTVKTRVTGWLCPDCIIKDPDYKLPARVTTPGMKDTRLAGRGESLASTG